MDEIDILTSQIDQLNETQVEQLRIRVKQVLKDNPDNLKALSVLARITQNPFEKINALNQILRLDPQDEWAKKELALFSKGDLIHDMNMEALKRANALIETGNLKQAEFLIDHVLSNNPQMADAWYLKAQITKDENAAINALREFLRINPDHETAKKRLASLLKKQQAAKEKKKIPITYILLGLAGLFVVCSAITAIFRPYLTDRTPTTAAGDGSPALPEIQDCRDVINTAMGFSNITCENIGRNQVCYGNYNVQANLLEGVTDPFAQVGDVIDIEKVSKLSASPLDMEKNLWGIAILKLPANLPGTLPGQNVTFMVLGDTSVNNTSGDMTAFYFTSGLTGIKCAEIPFDGVFIDTQDGQGIAFQANGVDVVLDGKSILHAQPDESMTVTVLEGRGAVTADGETQELSPGTSVSVPMDYDLNPTGPPSEPEPLPDGDALAACYLMGIDCPPEEDVLPPTNTPVPLPPDIPTNTPVPLPPDLATNTPVPVPSGQPTNTSVPLPTNTSAPLPTNTSAPLPTNTPVPGATATNTPLPPTATNTPLPPTATNTPLPPTATNTPVPPTATTSPCSGITSGSLVVDGSTLYFNIDNKSGSSIIIDTVTITWPAGNGSLEEIKLNTVTIFNDPVAPPSAVISSGDWSVGIGTRSIANNLNRNLIFVFELGADSTGYSVDVTFDVSCPIHKSK
jgi:hypothetical protein